jgi:hypothetical protein
MDRLDVRMSLRLGIAALYVGFAAGCETISAHTTSRNYGFRGDVPIDPPSAHSGTEDDCAEGGRLWKQYCGSCHNARPLGERPFANYHVAIAHMREQAYLTGKEYRQIVLFLRRWQDVGPPTPDVEPAPKRFEFSQPVSELRRDEQAADAAPPPAPGPGPFQPRPGQEPPAALPGAPP